jgi:hypothetical protein
MMLYRQSRLDLFVTASFQKIARNLKIATASCKKQSCGTMIAWSSCLKQWGSCLQAMQKRILARFKQEPHAFNMFPPPGMVQRCHVGL